MIKNLRHLLHCTRATAAVEAAIFLPIFLIFTLGITDLGSGMFVRMTVNAATQAGATYAVINSGSVCGSVPIATTCLNGIKAAMNDATNDASFCTGAVCTASIAACSDGPSTTCIAVSASYPFSPILPDVVYSWATATTILSTSTIRIL